MAEGGRHRSDRPGGVAGWAAVLGLVLVAVAVAGIAVIAAAALLGRA